MVRGRRLTRSASLLAAALAAAALLSAAATTDDRGAPPGWGSPAGSTERQPLAAIPDGVFTILRQMNRDLADLIELVEKNRVETLAALVRAIRGLKLDLMKHFPTVWGVEFSELFRDLEAIDMRLDDAKAKLPNGEKAAGELERARKRLDLLRGTLRGAPDRASIPDEVFEELGRLDRELRDLAKQLKDGKPEELSEKDARERINKIRRLKLRLLERFPAVFDITFEVVYQKLESLDEYLEGARVSFAKDRKKETLLKLRFAKLQKEGLERIFKLRAGKLALRITPSHTNDRVCVLVTTEPGAAIDYTAQGPSDYRSTGSFTLAADQTTVYAVSQITEPGEYVITVEGELEGKPPVTRTKTYSVPDLTSRGPLDCPDVEPQPPPVEEVECSGTLTAFGAGRQVARPPAGFVLEMIAAMICTRPSGSGSRPPLGVSITRFDIQLPGSRQVTNWLAPPGFTCGPVTRTTTKDTLRCDGPFPLGQTVTANVRMAPAGTAGMGASLYVLADGAEQGPFALTGP
jgi:hypothetical protein